MTVTTSTTEDPARARRVSAETGASSQASSTAGMLVSALVIPGQPEHVRAAREFAVLVLRVNAIDDDGIAGLLVSELVTNCLAHGNSGKPGGTITVTMTVMPGVVLVEVAGDDGGGEPVLGEQPDEESERGRGLRLVDELSTAWGYSGGKGLLVTWFELATATPPGPAAPGPCCQASREEDAGHVAIRPL